MSQKRDSLLFSRLQTGRNGEAHDAEGTVAPELLPRRRSNSEGGPFLEDPVRGSPPDLGCNIEVPGVAAEWQTFGFLSSSRPTSPPISALGESAQMITNVAFTTRKTTA